MNPYVYKEIQYDMDSDWVIIRKTGDPWMSFDEFCNAHSSTDQMPLYENLNGIYDCR